jgi:hypothetical protein
MDLRDLPESLAHVSSVGFALSAEQRSAMTSSLRLLKGDYRLERVALWGRVAASQRELRGLGLALFFFFFFFFFFFLIIIFIIHPSPLIFFGTFPSLSQLLLCIFVKCLNHGWWRCLIDLFLYMFMHMRDFAVVVVVE